MEINVDLHSHSRHGSFDGKRTYDEIAIESKAKGLDVVVITEHETITQPEPLQEVSNRHGVILLPGLELTLGDWGHFIILGGEDCCKNLKMPSHDKHSVIGVLDEIKNNLADVRGDFLSMDDLMTVMAKMRPLFDQKVISPVEFCQIVRENGGFVSWAHPLLWTPLRKALDVFIVKHRTLEMTEFHEYLKDDFQEVLEVFEAVDAVEGVNGGHANMLLNHLTVQLACCNGKAMTAGSDGHREGEFGTAYLSIDAKREDITDIHSLIYALRTRNCSISGDFVV